MKLTRKARRSEAAIQRRKRSDKLQRAIGDAARHLAAHVERLHRHAARDEAWVTDWVARARAYFDLCRYDNASDLVRSKLLLDERLPEWLGRLRFHPSTKGEVLKRRVERGWECLRQAVGVLESKVRREEASRRLGHQITTRRWIHLDPVTRARA